MQKRVNFSLDDSVYKEFQKLCKDNDIIVSKRVERLIKEETEELKKLNKKRGEK